MRHLIKHTLHLFLASFSTVGLTLMVGHFQPPSPLSKTLTFLHLLDCQLPCWIGIIPGKTTIGEARTLIESAYPTEAYEFTLDRNIFDGTEWLQIRNRKDDSALSVSFNIWKAPKDKIENTVIFQITLGGAELSLGDWYYMLGRPKALSVTWGNEYAVPNLLYVRQRARLTLYNPRDNFAVDNPSIPAGTLDIYDQPEWNKTYLPRHIVMWHGFSQSTKDEIMALMLP